MLNRLDEPTARMESCPACNERAGGLQTSRAVPEAVDC